MPDRLSRGLLLAVLLLPGCGGAPTGPAAPSTSPGPTAGTTTEEATVTEDDDGRELVVQVGDEVSLQLDSAWTWSAPRVTGDDAVRLDPVDHLVDPGYVEWLVVGVAPGTSEVEVAGEPERMLHLTVQVRG